MGDVTRGLIDGDEAGLAAFTDRQPKAMQTPAMSTMKKHTGPLFTETPVKSEDTMAFIDNILHNAEASNAKNESGTRDFRLPEYDGSQGGTKLDDLFGQYGRELQNLPSEGGASGANVSNFMSELNRLGQPGNTSTLNLDALLDK